MIEIEEKTDMVSPFKNKKIVVVGLARSGTGAANLLSSLGANVTVIDGKQRIELEHFIRDLPLSVKVITGGTPEELFLDAEMIVISPGVPMDIPPLVSAKASGIPVIGELEIAYRTVQLMNRLKELNSTACPAFIGITGTNGKSTTATLVDMMLKGSGLKSLLAGNIGNALTGEIDKIISEKNELDVDCIVTEISSFQLESIESFRPAIAAILNISSDHLDRYDGMSDYMNAKARIFENQINGDYLVLNADDEDTMELYRSRLKTQGEKKPEVYFFSSEKEVKGIFLKGDEIYCNIHLPDRIVQEPLMNINKLKVKGVHNIENAMAASLIALLAGGFLDSARKVLRDFPGLEHRLEFVGEIRGVRFINDSKGTNIGAVEKSLMSFEKVVLIMGGIDKGGDFSRLSRAMSERVKCLILIGEAKEKIAQVLGEETEVYKAGSLNEAVEKAMSLAVSGDTVLLSPGCASFDMFKNFEDRGARFKDAVSRLHLAGEKG